MVVEHRNRYLINCLIKNLCKVQKERLSLHIYMSFLITPLSFIHSVPEHEHDNTSGTINNGNLSYKSTKTVTYNDGRVDDRWMDFKTIRKINVEDTSRDSSASSFQYIITPNTLHTSSEKCMGHH